MVATALRPPLAAGSGVVPKTPRRPDLHVHYDEYVSMPFGSRPGDFVFDPRDETRFDFYDWELEKWANYHGVWPRHNKIAYHDPPTSCSRD